MQPKQHSFGDIEADQANNHHGAHESRDQAMGSGSTTSYQHEDHAYNAADQEPRWEYPYSLRRVVSDGTFDGSCKNDVSIAPTPLNTISSREETVRTTTTAQEQGFGRASGVCEAVGVREDANAYSHASLYSLGGQQISTDKQLMGASSTTREGQSCYTSLATDGFYNPPVAPGSLLRFGRSNNSVSTSCYGTTQSNLARDSIVGPSSIKSSVDTYVLSHGELPHIHTLPPAGRRNNSTTAGKPTPAGPMPFEYKRSAEKQQYVPVTTAGWPEQTTQPTHGEISSVEPQPEANEPPASSVETQVITELDPTVLFDKFQGLLSRIKHEANISDPTLLNAVILPGLMYLVHRVNALPNHSSELAKRCRDIENALQ